MGVYGLALVSGSLTTTDGAEEAMNLLAGRDRELRIKTQGRIGLSCSGTAIINDGYTRRVDYQPKQINRLLLLQRTKTTEKNQSKRIKYGNDKEHNAS